MIRHTLGFFLLLSFTAALPAKDYPQRKSITLPDDNAVAKLPPGPGVEKARAYCSICHSTDYIVRQPKMDAAHWQAEVKKMITVYGAPISAEDAKTISDYLSSAYGSPASKPGKPGK